MPKIGKPPPLPPGLSAPGSEVSPKSKVETKQPHPTKPPPSYEESQGLPSVPPPGYEESRGMPSTPPPGWAEDQVAPTIPPPSYDESKGFPSNPPPPPLPRDSNLGLPAAPSSGTMPTLSTEAAIGLTEATAILSGSRATSQAVSSEVDRVMQQLDGIKSGSTIATYADLGLGTAAEVLNNAGLLDAYVVACKAAPVVQGASTALAVLDGVKAVYDHQKIGGDIERLQ